ncbi:hypothetical protein, partial [uncultured Thiodictyon sp.]|uniref:hypothetical protein n=1 Tax=uncultured Thiodictyon sp. TaxID=1846217 RepID=UPI0025FD7816
IVSVEFHVRVRLNGGVPATPPTVGVLSSNTMPPRHRVPEGGGLNDYGEFFHDLMLLLVWISHQEVEEGASFGTQIDYKQHLMRNQADTPSLIQYITESVTDQPLRLS